MQLPLIVRTHVIPYVLLAILLAFALTIQLRLSMQTVHVERSLDLYIPLLIKPFTTEVDAFDYLNWEPERQTQGGSGSYSGLRYGDRLLQVNGQVFAGMAVYLRELWKTQHRPWKPFVLTVISSDSRTRGVALGFPHCTCGIPTFWQAVAIWTIPPIICILLGFAATALKPFSKLAWCYLVLMLSLSQLQYWEEPYRGFQFTVSPMIWTDWLRVPAIVYQSFIRNAWPVALVIGSLQICRPTRVAYRFAVCLAALFLVVAALRAALDVAWSEEFHTLAPLYRLLEKYRTELIIVSLANVAAFASTVKRSLGIAVGAIAVSAVVSLLWTATPVMAGEWIHYSDDTQQFRPVFPPFRNTPEFIILAFVAACLFATTITFRQTISVRLGAGAIFCLPLAVHVAGALGNYWYAFLGPGFEHWPWLVLSTAGLGLVLITWWVSSVGH